MRYGGDGQVTFAGAHEEILLWRTSGGCERIATRGTWLGAVRDIDKVTEDQTLQLQPGDLMILYTDGLIESRNATASTSASSACAALVDKHRPPRRTPSARRSSPASSAGPPGRRTTSR
jgi:sigma-B regulation protein RsbU (phosphoserine phosphatase)